MLIYLYVKTHRKTGLKYLGKTTNIDPYTYQGSGADWKIHLKEHGYDCNTEIIKECYSNAELSKWGRYYSNLWNVAESLEWANRIPETGGGGNCTDDQKEVIRQKLLGKKKPPRKPEHTEKLAATRRGKPNPKTAEGLRKWHDSNPNRKDALQKISISIKQWYANNPTLSHAKILKSWDTRYLNDYNKYETIIRLIGQHKTNKEIVALIPIDGATLRKLRSQSHRVFSLFPEFKQLLST